MAGDYNWPTASKAEGLNHEQWSDSMKVFLPIKALQQVVSLIGRTSTKEDRQHSEISCSSVWLEEKLVYSPQQMTGYPNKKVRYLLSLFIKSQSFRGDWELEEYTLGMAHLFIYRFQFLNIHPTMWLLSSVARQESERNKGM